MIVSEHIFGLIKIMSKKWSELYYEVQNGSDVTSLNNIEQELRILDKKFNWVERAHTDTKRMDWDWLFSEQNKRFRQFNMRGKEYRFCHMN